MRLCKRFEELAEGDKVIVDGHESVVIGVYKETEEIRVRRRSEPVDEESNEYTYSAELTSSVLELWDYPDDFPTFNVGGLWGGGLRCRAWKFETEFSRSGEAHVILIRLPSDNDGPLDIILWFHHEGVERYTTAEFFDNADANDSDEDRACKSMDETIKATIAGWDEEDKD
jgi:hypothetical protein